MIRRQKLGRYTALTTIIAIFAVCLAVSLHGVITQQQAEKRELAHVQWIAANLEFEFQRLLKTLTLYAYGSEDTDKAELDRRLDVLWSRLPLFLQGETGALFATVDQVHETVRDLSAELERLDPTLRALEPGDNAAYEHVRGRLNAFSERVYGVTLDSFIATEAESAIYDQGLNRAYLLLAGSLIGILVSGSLIIVFLVLEVGRAYHAEATALEARYQSEQANRAKSDFLAHMSHELRTPLNAIIGFATIIERAMLGPLGNKRYREYGRDISASGTHLLSLINDILDLSRIEAGKFELDETDIDLADVVRSSLLLVRDRAAAAQIALKEVVPRGLPPLHADDRAVKQILLNLLSNAVRYTLEGGQVNLRVALEKDGCLCVTIKDSGIGMNPEELQKALMPFQQADNLLTRRYHGAGLGLPLAKHLAELHGGELILDSQPGRGTTASVRFPSWRVRRPSLAA